MRKKLKLIAITIFLSAVLIAGIIEIGKIFNIYQSDVEDKELTEIAATASKGSSFTAGSLGGVDTSHMYTFISDGNTFCAGHGWTLTLRKNYSDSGTPLPDYVGNGRSEVVTYKNPRTTEMAQSIAYARAFGGSKEAIQKLVWASRDWSSYTGGCCLVDKSEAVNVRTNSGGIEGRATQFANFVYKALKNQKLGIKCTPINENDSSLKIMVNQSNKTYTVGPYKISFDQQNIPATKGSENMGELVYKEIIGGNKGQTSANSFCTGKIGAKIIYENGSSTNVGQSSITLIDKNGNAMSTKFPKFDDEFYIRYSAGDAKIKEIKPLVQVNYLEKITNNGSVYHDYTYTSSKIEFNMIQDNGGLLEDAIKTLANRNIIQRYSNTNGRCWIIGNTTTNSNMKTMWHLPGSGGILESFCSGDRTGIKNWLQNNIASRITGWGLSNVNVTIEAYYGFYYGNTFYSMINDPTHTETIEEINTYDMVKDTPNGGKFTSSGVSESKKKYMETKRLES